MRLVLKTILRRPPVQQALAWFAAWYIRFVFKTTRWQRQGWEIPERYIKEGKGFITCFWHNRLLMGCFGWPGHGIEGSKQFHMLISSHADGQLIAKTVAYHGIKTIAGSTNRGGGQALRAMVRLLKQGHTVGITPDGPRGPCYSVSEGILGVAKLAAVDILPFTYSTNHCIILKTWDNFRLALPFGKGVLAWGQPFKRDETQPLNQQSHSLRQMMLELCLQVDKQTNCTKKRGYGEC